MRGLLVPDPPPLRMSAKYPADPIYAPANPSHTTSLNVVVDPAYVVNPGSWS
jgi:hypothetical protein